MKGLVPLIICGIVVYVMVRPMWVSFREGAYVLLGAYALAALITLGGMGARAARRSYYRRRSETYRISRRY